MLGHHFDRAQWAVFAAVDARLREARVRDRVYRLGHRYFMMVD